MSREDRARIPRDKGEDGSRVVVGPWENLPKTKPVRQPILKIGKGPREAIIGNWRALAICVVLLVVAPPLAGWLAHLIMTLSSRG
jgi:hypothetical protein